MGGLTWNPEWETGVAEIDRQHQALVARIDGLFQALTRGEAGEVGSTLLFLATYVDTHFADEEALMARSAYPALQQHHTVHVELQDRVRLLIEDYRRDPAGITEAVVDLLADWLLTHIDQHDRALASHLKARQPRAARA